MTVDDYINFHAPDHQLILHWLRRLILNAAPGVHEKISWNVPFYTYRGESACYLNVLRRPKHQPAVDLAFLRGIDLADEGGLLESRDRKTVRSLVIHNVADGDEDLVRTYIQEALLLIDNRRTDR